MSTCKSLKDRVAQLRGQLKIHQLQGYAVATTDEFLSEYAPAYAKRLEYITGFTGSNGLAIILFDKILFFTDGRYLTQCESELDKDECKIFDQKILKDFPWRDYIAEGLVGYDPKIFALRMLNLLPQNFLYPLETNLIDEIWSDQPAKPCSEVYAYPVQYAGKGAEAKIALCRELLKNHNADALIVTDPHAVCWLLNIRGHDIEYTPIILAYAIVTAELVYLLTNDRTIPENIVNQDNLRIRHERISALPELIDGMSGKILFDKNLASSYVVNLLAKKPHIAINDPCQLWKAVKNYDELEHIKNGHIQDAVAMCEFIAWLNQQNKHELAELDEYKLGLILTSYRAQQPDYVMDSFPAICGFQENGAVIHYRASKYTAKKLSGEGLLLIDSGGQYLGATTDITRVITIGELGANRVKYQEFYTRVLKGHLALSMIKFPKNIITGAHLDVLARQYLWQAGLDYAHGTGHGVGAFLSVHEGPHNISLSGFGAKIEAGMVMSNEPGYYVPGQLGIRIENLIYAKQSGDAGFLEFESLTLVPYAKDLIDFSMLSKAEKEYLEEYYEVIKQKIMPLLSESAQNWLKDQVDI